MWKETQLSDLRALTLHRPWEQAFYLPSPNHKDVENRSWKPPECINGKHICLHAGKAWDMDGALFIQKQAGKSFTEDDSPPSQIVGLVMVTGYTVTNLRNSRWFFGPIGWQLDDYIKLERPVPCRGHQGVWRVPREVADQVLQQLSFAQRRRVYEREI